MALVELYRKLVPEACRNTVRRYIKRLRHSATTAASYRYDRVRFLRAASPFRDFRHVQNQLAYTSVLAHSIEKGMSLPHPRLRFGAAKVEELALLLTQLLQTGTTDSRVGHAIGVLQAWLRWNRSRKADPSAVLSQRIVDLQEQYIANGLDAAALNSGNGHPIAALAGIGSADAQHDFSALTKNRHSIRNFSDKQVSIDLVLAAARTAQSTPTLCNRQSCHIHLFRNDKRGRRMLALQAGNTGFTECIPLFAVITSELYCFLDTDERNQCWVEGGMFAMTFVYALHALGLGTCCLNWAKSPDTDRDMHALSGIPESERIVMLIAVGNIHPDCVVTDSPLRARDEIIHTHWTPGT